MKVKPIAISLVFVILAFAVYTFIEADKDREGRILFSMVILDFEKIMPELENEITSSGKLSQRQELANGNYANSMDAIKKYSYTISINPNSVEIKFPEKISPLSGKTVIFEPVVSNGGIKWLCNRGTIEARYRSPRCRNEQGIARVVKSP